VVNGARWSRASVSPPRLVGYSASRAGETRSPIAGNRRSEATFRTITNSGRNGRLGYQVCPALMFTAAERVAFTAGVRAGEFN
jgi:hypothetical protein